MKRQLYLTIFSIIAFYNNCFSQTFQKTYGTSLDEFAFSIQQTFDGGFILVGQTGNIGLFNNDILIIRLDMNGDTIWTKTFGDVADDVAYSIIQTKDSAFAITGYTMINGNGKMFLLKINFNGNVTWLKTYGGLANDYGNVVIQTYDNGFILLGSTVSYGSGGLDAYLIKTDSWGDTLWTKTFGGIDNDWGYNVVQTPDSGFILCGKTSSTIGGDDDGYLIKTDKKGNIIWANTYGGIGQEGINSILQTNDGGFVFAGSTSSFGAGAYDIYLSKVNSTGNILWSKTFGGGGFDGVRSLKQATDNGFILSGEYNPNGTIYWDAYLIKTDSVGILQWAKTYGSANTDLGYDVLESMDGGFVITGSTKSFGAGGNDVYLIKTDSAGNSGCNQTNYITQTTSPFIPYSNWNCLVSSGANINNPLLNIGSGLNVSTLCSTVGVNEFVLQNSFQIYPNPSNGIFSINISKIIDNSTILISDMLGNIFYNKTFSGLSNQKIELGNISKGIYILSVNNNKIKYSQKIIIN